jgi:hypothetical protein
MVIKTKTADIRIVEKIVKILKQKGFQDVHIMRQTDKKFVIAVVGPGADTVGMETLEEVRQLIIITRNSKFFVDNYTLFQEAWEFLQNFDNQRQKKSVNA